MNTKEVEKLLMDVKNGQTDIEEALEILKNFASTNLGFARIDHHREMRTGYPEIIYCAGKTIEQVKEIFRVMSERENNVIGTRASKEMYEAIRSILPDAVFFTEARIISLQKKKQQQGELACALLAPVVGAKPEPQYFQFPSGCDAAPSPFRVLRACDRGSGRNSHRR